MHIEVVHRYYFSLLQNIKKGLLNKEKAAAVFFDFTDAFGSVNRKRLLYKIC